MPAVIDIPFAASPPATGGRLLQGNTNCHFHFARAKNSSQNANASPPHTKSEHPKSKSVMMNPGYKIRCGISESRYAAAAVRVRKGG
jgi:hypothetical protein